jgi:hypothetical protein
MAQGLDRHPIRPWCKVDLHQLNKEDGSKGNRYECITPNECLVQANHVANRACDYTMGTMEGCERNAIFEQPCLSHHRTIGLTLRGVHWQASV